MEGGRPQTSRVVRRCDSSGAQEPWFGYDAGMFRFREQTWRWPHELSAGAVFEGSVLAAMSTIEIDLFRSYHVREREHVRVPAGEFDAWRVESADTTVTNPTPVAAGTYWVAEGIGLVRTEQAITGSERMVAELTSWTDAP